MHTIDPQLFFGKADLTDSCWLWKGVIYKTGYGAYGKKKALAHRIAYEMIKGKIPKDFCIDHLCRVRNCINPDHLEAVTMVENVMRGESQHAINARKTHCRHGHEFTPSNTYIHPKRGSRLCRSCRVVNTKKYLDKMLNRKVERG